jgi:sirohydrochlorin cobaltochelatase
VDAIRQRNCFDEVTAAFWKEQPSLGTVLEGLQPREVTIVPLFASEGYFSQVVLPAELNSLPGQTITITEAVGVSAFFAEVVAASVESAIRAENLKADEVGVVIVGHGTPRHDESQATTNHQADLLRQSGRFAQVHSVFLDEAPFIRNIYEATRSDTLVIVPYFIAQGMHTQQDIPAALGLSAPFYAPQTVRGRRVIYTPPIGLHNDLFRVVMRLAGENPDAEAKGSVWQGFPARAATGDAAIGQISLQHPDYLCHVDDIHTAPDDLAPLNTPAQIRARLRFDAEGNYRPLPTETNLPGGWIVPAPGDVRRAAVIETIYPGILVKIDNPRPAAEVGARQKGKYRPVRRLSTQQITSLMESVCGRCVRHPTWFDGAPTQPGCIEPCSFWLEEAIQ